jgi:hypothetical protein
MPEPMAEALPTARRRFRSFLHSVPQSAQVVVFCHFDADGLAAGALLGRDLPRLGFSNVDIVSSLRGESAFSDAARERLRARRPDALVVTDLGVHRDGVLPDVPTAYVDHHIDAIIGLSVVYKGMDNIGAFRRWLGFQPDTRAATLIFGFFHGFGLATKILDYEMSRDGLFPNLLAFNVGVEIGQLLALSAILIAMTYWRRTPSFQRHAYTGNVVLMTAGFVLMGYQLAGFFLFDV